MLAAGVKSVPAKLESYWSGVPLAEQHPSFHRWICEFSNRTVGSTRIVHGIRLVIEEQNVCYSIMQDQTLAHILLESMFVLYT
ncbi:hypothetical protein Ancab_011389 [Ancistrocladus abbreviatus]